MGHPTQEAFVHQRTSRKTQGIYKALNVNSNNINVITYLKTYIYIYIIHIYNGVLLSH